MASFVEVVAIIEIGDINGFELLAELSGGLGSVPERAAHLAARHLPSPAEQAEGFSTAGAIPAVLGALKGDALPPAAAAFACAGLRNLLSSLGVDECAAVVAAGGAAALVRALRAHAAAPAVCAPAAGALFNISQAHPVLRPALAEAGAAAALAGAPPEVAGGGVARLLLDSLAEVVGRPPTPTLPAAILAAGAAQRWAAAAGAAELCALTGGEGGFAARERVLVAQGTSYDARIGMVAATGAIPALLIALELHGSHVAVVAPAVAALRNLASSTEKVAREVAGGGAMPLLVAALRAHGGKEAVAVPAAGALLNILGVKELVAQVGAVEGVGDALVAAARAAGEVALKALARLGLNAEGGRLGGTGA
jgi:hypothetical protein